MASPAVAFSISPKEAGGAGFEVLRGHILIETMYFRNRRQLSPNVWRAAHHPAGWSLAWSFLLPFAGVFFTR